MIWFGMFYSNFNLTLSHNLKSCDQTTTHAQNLYPESWINCLPQSVVCLKTIKNPNVDCHEFTSTITMRQILCLCNPQKNYFKQSIISYLKNETELCLILKLKWSEPISTHIHMYSGNLSVYEAHIWHCEIYKILTTGTFHQVWHWLTETYFDI